MCADLPIDYYRQPADDEEACATGVTYPRYLPSPGAIARLDWRSAETRHPATPDVEYMRVTKIHDPVGRQCFDARYLHGSHRGTQVADIYWDLRGAWSVGYDKYYQADIDQMRNDSVHHPIITFHPNAAQLLASTLGWVLFAVAHVQRRTQTTSALRALVRHTLYFRQLWHMVAVFLGTRDADVYGP